MMDGLETALRELLDGGGPPAAVVRGLMSGLQTALSTLARDGSAPDPAVLTRAVDAIDRLAAPEPPPFAAAAPAVVAAPAGGLVGALTALWPEAAKRADQRDPGAPPNAPGPLWEALHLLSLRMAPADAADLSARAARAAVAEGAEAVPATVTILGPARETLLPGLRAGDRVLAPGLATDPQAPPPDGLAAGPGADGLLRLVSPVLYLLEADPYLAHCLQVLQFTGLADLAALGEKDRLRTQLLGRAAAVAAADPSTQEWLEHLVRAHEAVSSVVHSPPAHDDSWWGRLRTQGHTLVRDAAAPFGPGLVKLPSATFVSARALTEHDIPLKVPTRSGMVLACVRLWSNIGGTERPGRVIYAS
ncbi:hypothetical protein [Dactylosporangium sp. CA-139066]|uniref:hypothetical protein n=1 Tax=Dactylosporangium sp. CA-139066 TaxID=3239930 RepID=UPI003D8BFE35